MKSESAKKMVTHMSNDGRIKLPKNHPASRKELQRYAEDYSKLPKPKKYDKKHELAVLSKCWKCGKKYDLMSQFSTCPHKILWE